MANTKTAYDIVIRALQIMNYIAAEEQPAARDYQAALEKYYNFHDWIIQEFTKTARWQADAVDARVWTYVAGWLAQDLSFEFQPSAEDLQRINAGAELAQRRMREILARKRIQVTEAEYY